jgi:predicted lactoylglutathione lyase
MIKKFFNKLANRKNDGAKDYFSKLGFEFDPRFSVDRSLFVAANINGYSAVFTKASAGYFDSRSAAKR